MIPLNDPDIRRRSTPHVVRVLLLANLLVAGYQMLFLGPVAEAVFIYRFGVIPWELTGQGEMGLGRIGPGGATVDLSSPIPVWVTMFTSMFLHGGLIHLGSNMLFLWVFGRNIEDRFGHMKFLLAYLLAGVAAVWAQVYVNPDSQVPMIGASGAIAGVLGAYIVMFPRSRIDTLFIVGIIFHARVPALLLLGGWAILQAFSGIGALEVAQVGGVAYFAHLGGFAAGVAFGLLYRPFGGPPNPGGSPTRYWRGRRLD